MNSVLVTGGAGFIGSNFVYYWHSIHPNDAIVVLDVLTYAGNLQTLAPLLEKREIIFVQGDICDEALLAELFAQYSFTHIVHFAAESHVDRSISTPDAFIRTNVTGTHTLLKAARGAFENKHSLVRFHHISTDEVYGSLGPYDPAFTETTPYTPRSPYAASKAASDHLVRAYSHTFGLPVTISNCSNNYGPYHFPEKLIPLMIVNSLSGIPLPVYGDGSNVRDWLHVSDHCAAVATILECGEPGETYNIGGNNEVSNIDLVHTLCDMVDARFATDTTLKVRFPQAPAALGRRTKDLIIFVKDRPGHDRRYAIDATKISRTLGFRPRETFIHGLSNTLDWYLANESWWRAVQSGAYRNWVTSHYGFSSLSC